MQTITLTRDSRELLDSDPSELSPALRSERALLQRRVSAAGRIEPTLARLDAATLDSTVAEDKRRVLAQESNSLRAATQLGDTEHAGRAVLEAERVLDMWQSA